MMKVFEFPSGEAYDAWVLYNDGMNMRGYIEVSVDDDLRFCGYEEEYNSPYIALYNWLITNGAEHGETVLVNYDW